VIKKLRGRFTTGRALVTTLLILIQLVWFATVFLNIIDYSLVLDALLRVFTVIMTLYLIRKNENPAYRMSWIILMGLLPIFGGLFYALFGNKRPSRRMAAQVANQVAKDYGQAVSGAYPHLLEQDSRLASLSYYIEQTSNLPVYGDTRVDYYAAGELALEPLLEALRSAERYILLEFFIMNPGLFMDQVFEVLVQKADQGVEVRVIYDDFGCLTTLPSDFVAQMEAIGIKCLQFNPFTPVISLAVNNRDHRKIVVVDGKVGFTGGMNLADEYINEIERFGYWKDNLIRLEGPGVWSLATLFLDMWNAFYPKKDINYETFKDDTLAEQALRLADPSQGYVQVYGDTPLDNEPLGENVYRDMLNIAQDYVYIYTPYLVISYELQTAMTLAARRGVDVRLMTPGIPDKKMVFRMTRSYYRPLIEAGVKIYEFSPGFLHAKTFVADDRLASVGTINLDYRSLYLHFELSAMLYDHPVIPTIKADFLATQAQARQITLADTRNTLTGMLWDAVLRIVAPFV